MPRKAHRVNTHKPNGAPSESLEPIPMTQETLATVLPTPEAAIEHIKKLGELNDIALAAHSKHDEAAIKAKALKAKAEDADEAVRNYIKEMTHPAHPSLFDAAVQEADTQKMEAARTEPASANAEPL